MKRNYYTARWSRTGTVSIANVSFWAANDYTASLQADKIARELNVTGTPRTITCEGRVTQCLTRGVK